ncbi:MAG: hypothetical protein V1867_05105 [Candidatus Falkowbacteria bacterium]
MFSNFKKIIFIFSAAYVLFGVFSASLATENTELLPINRKERAQNTLKRNELIRQYGESEFYRCFGCSGEKLNNPFAVEACLFETEYCLKKIALPEPNCREGLVFSVGRCITPDRGCRERFGENGYYLGFEEENNYACGCRNGYSWNNDKSLCVQTACPDNYIYYSPYRDSDGGVLFGRCLDRDDACRGEFGDNGIFYGLGPDGGYLCGCAAGWEWNKTKTACSEAVTVKGIAASFEDETAYFDTVSREKAALLRPDSDLAERLRGRILLQVEENGEAWYVDPGGRKRYFLHSPARAFTVMRSLGLGATHDFLTAHVASYPDHVLGKILIDVDDLGRAYYINPGDRLAYYLGSPAEAFTVMRNLGLGINNKDIRKLEMGD